MTSISSFDPKNRYVLAKHVVLVGMMGAGKTSVARAFAPYIERAVFDLDDEIAYNNQCSISEIFTQNGEKAFRQMETNMLCQLLKKPATIISTGGGAFINEKNRAMIDKYGFSVYLRLEIDTLYQRVKNSKDRPLLHAGDVYKTLKKIYQERAMLYEQADDTIDVDAHMTNDEVCKCLLKLLERKKLVVRDA